MTTDPKTSQHASFEMEKRADAQAREAKAIARAFARPPVPATRRPARSPLMRALRWLWAWL